MIRQVPGGEVVHTSTGASLTDHVLPSDAATYEVVLTTDPGGTSTRTVTCTTQGSNAVCTVSP